MVGGGRLQARRVGDSPRAAGVLSRRLMCERTVLGCTCRCSYCVVGVGEVGFARGLPPFGVG